MSNPSVSDHYRRRSIINVVRGRLAEAGYDLADLDPYVLAGIDEFHLGGRLATTTLIASLDLRDASVLDIGCGIGGAARTIATSTESTVVGIDLTPEFVAAASELSELVGCSDRTTFEVADALDLPFGAAAFDAATLFHVGMNIANKVDLFAEVARVLRPGGTILIYDIMRIGEGEFDLPVPWSSHAETSHVARPLDYVEALTSAGFDVGTPIDRIELLKEAAGLAAKKPPILNLADLMGDDWPVMFGNLKAAVDARVLSPTEIVATRPR